MGDDLRRVHWRSSARTGELMVRQMVDVSLPHTTIVLDNRRAAYCAGSDVDEEAYELAVEAAASVARTALLHRFPLRLLTETGAVLADSRRGIGLDELLDLLAMVDMSDEPTVAGALDELERGRVAGTLVLVTGRGDLSGASALARLTVRLERQIVIRTGAAGDETAAEDTGLPAEAHCLRVEDAAALVTAWQREVPR